MTEGINFADLVKEFSGGFEPLAPGEYDVVVDTAESVLSKNGKQMIKVRFKIQGGPSSGRTVFWNAVFSPRRDDGSVNEGALKAWFGNMSAFGLKTAFFSANPSMEQIADALIGKAVRVVLAIREWQGQEQNDVKSIKPPAGGAIEVAAPGGGMFSGGIGGAGAVGSPSSTGSVAPESIGNLPPVAAEDEEDDEAPF